MKMRACWHSSHQFHCSTRRSSWLTSIYRRSLMPSIWLIGTHSLTDGRGCCPSLSFWPFLSWVSYPPERPDFLMNRRRRPGASSAEAQLFCGIFSFFPSRPVCCPDINLASRVYQPLLFRNIVFFGRILSLLF